MKNIHKELHNIFSQLEVPFGKGYFIGTGNEPVFVVYLPYSEDVTGRAENKIAQVTNRLKVDIIARNGNSFTETEEKVRKLLSDNGYDFRNAESEVEQKEPYNYIRTLYYNKNYYFEDLTN